MRSSQANPNRCWFAQRKLKWMEGKNKAKGEEADKEIVESRNFLIH
jgi:hypothetical protein